jgi:hypothetical protein
MKRIAPDLYATLEETSSFVSLIKGDLNYRKLIGDLNWPYYTPLAQAVGTFRPTAFWNKIIWEREWIISRFSKKYFQNYRQ